MSTVGLMQDPDQLIGSAASTSAGFAAGISSTLSMTTAGRRTWSFLSEPLAAAVDVAEESLEGVGILGRRFLDRGAQEFSVGAGRNNGFDVCVILGASREKLHDDDGVDRRNRNAVAEMGIIEPIFDDAQAPGQGHLIDVDPVEFDNRHPHGNEPARMRFERLVTHQEIDVLSLGETTKLASPKRMNHRRLCGSGRNGRNPFLSSYQYGRISRSKSRFRIVKGFDWFCRCVLSMPTLAKSVCLRAHGRFLFFWSTGARHCTDEIRDQTCAFQAQLQIESDHSFVSRPDLQSLESEEWDNRVADLQYRDACEFAAGMHIFFIENDPSVLTS